MARGRFATKNNNFQITLMIFKPFHQQTTDKHFALPLKILYKLKIKSLTIDLNIKKYLIYVIKTTKIIKDLPNIGNNKFTPH